MEGAKLRTNPLEPVFSYVALPFLFRRPPSGYKPKCSFEHANAIFTYTNRIPCTFSGWIFRGSFWKFALTDHISLLYLFRFPFFKKIHFWNITCEWWPLEYANNLFFSLLAVQVIEKKQNKTSLLFVSTFFRTFFRTFRKLKESEKFSLGSNKMFHLGYF